jgi:hypothetical protein
MHLSYLKTAFKGFLSLVTVYIFSLSPGLAQMRQMYLDADEDNHINKVSFYSPNEGYKWLQNYQFRVNLNLWVFVFPMLAAFGLAMATISFQVIKAALTTPVKSLKTE